MSVPREYDKLVRDRIPEIIRENGETLVTHRVEGEAYRDYLAAKLLEEADEYAESRELDELADVLEVLDAIREARDVDTDELDAIRASKAAERGGFADGVVLDRVED